MTPAAIGSKVMLYTNAHAKLNLALRNTVRESLISVSIAHKFDDTNTNFALKMAISEPEPIAIPTSAASRAGASLMPSPTIATIALLPCCGVLERKIAASGFCRLFL
jgi:hypothetical protein